MPKVEIDEAELQTLRGATQLLDQLQANPKTRRDFQRAVKVIQPNIVTDEDRLKEAPEIQKLTSLEDRFDKFLKSQEEREIDTKMSESFSRLRSDQHFTDEGIEAVKKLMVDRKIPDPEAAAALWQKQNPPPPLQPNSLFQSSGFGFGSKAEDADTKLLFEDEDAFAEREFFKVMTEAA